MSNWALLYYVYILRISFDWACPMETAYICRHFWMSDSISRRSWDDSESFRNRK